MTQRSKLGALFVSAVMLCSCGTVHAVVADHNVGGMELAAGIVTVYSESVPAPEIQPAEAAEEPEFIAVMLPERVEAEAIPIPEVHIERVPVTTEAVRTTEAAETTTVTMQAPAETEATTAGVSEPSVSINSSMLALTSSSKKYIYEQQKTNGSVLLLGANLVYVGESFDFDYIYPDKKPDTDMFWSVIGSGGSIDQNGVFTAKERSVCTVIATDRDTGAFASMKVHCIVNADDVDFIPLVNGIPIANKTYPLPKDYDPGLDPATHDAFIRMQKAAKAEGLTIYPVSAYRGYNYQQKVYAGWKSMYGSNADLISARPGHSEHQLGLAIDVNSAEYAFANTAEGKWLREHCAEYGFILRYPSNASQTYTGYNYEPWHIRYVGTDLAKKITASGMTLEELLHIDSYYR